MDRLTRIALGSIGVSLLVLGLKGLAWWMTGSAALFSDALESIVNVAAAGMALAAIRLSAEPPDRNHPFGHAKAELFAAVVEGAMIVVAAVLILQHVWNGLGAPARLSAPWLGTGINLAASVVNAAWAAALGRFARTHHSPALDAESRHLWSDVVTSAVLVAGLVAAIVTGLHILDPLLAAAAAAYILWAGYALMRDSVGGLMDAAAGPEVVARIESLVAEHAAGALEAHDIRTRSAGRQTFLQFHLVVPGAMSVAAAHDICDRIEQGIAKDLPQVVTTIHVEPDNKAKPDEALVL